MKRVIITLALLIIVTGLLYVSLMQPNGTVEKTITVDQSNINEAEVTSVKHNATSPKTIKTPEIKPDFEKNVQIHDKEKYQLDLQITSENSITKLSDLPQAMQEEIKTLSGRYNQNVQPIEVQPGVFMMPPGKNIRVVPVAIMNKDGTVSTYEY